MNTYQKKYLFGNIIKLLKSLNLSRKEYLQKKQEFYDYIFGKKEKIKEGEINEKFNWY